MKRILYAGSFVLTQDDIAHMVVMYAATLGQAGRADTIVIPVMKERIRSTAEILIGPSSQLIIEDAGPDYGKSPDDEALLRKIEDQCRSMENPAEIQPQAAGTQQLVFDDL